jgi:hypothetical protein
MSRQTELEPRQIYSWDNLGKIFGFKPNWLSTVGGMASIPRHHAVLLITHPYGGKSFDYRDVWDNHDLIYTGRGQFGDQQLTGANRLRRRQRPDHPRFRTGGTEIAALPRSRNLRGHTNLPGARQEWTQPARLQVPPSIQLMTTTGSEQLGAKAPIFALLVTVDSLAIRRRGLGRS